MILWEAEAKRVRIELVCKTCGARQPSYIKAMIDRHGPETELNIALKRTPCFFCEELGQFTAVVLTSD